MLIETYRYREFWDTPQFWQVEQFHLGKTNLLVGRNSSGKSRVVNTISSLARFWSQGTIQGWVSGEWLISMRNGEALYEIEVKIEGACVVHETIKVDGVTKLERRPDGTGRVWYEKVGQFIDFEVTQTTIAVVSRRDRLQHTFLEPIFVWASNLRQYQFSTDLGRQMITMLPIPGSNPENAETAVATQASTDQNAAVDQYHRGFQAFAKSFDQAILRDLEAVGYSCSSVGTDVAPNLPMIGGNLPIMLQVQENELQGPTRQFEMSTGMFRALAIIIHVNFALFSDANMTLLIDDIGEGLDFERSKALVDLLLERCANSRIQLILTSNDRFVMNEVDLAHWHVLDRTAHIVTIKDAHNSSEEFRRFKSLGLSNFDFFSMKAYQGLVH